MKKNIKITICIISVMLLVVFAGIMTAMASTPTPSIMGVTPLSGEVSEAITTEIQALEISRGELKLVAEQQNHWGDQRLICQDDNYQYFIDAESSKVVSMVLNSERLDKLANLSTDIRTAKDYTALVYSYTDTFLRSFGKNTMKIESHINAENPVEYVSFEIIDQVGDCLVNTGYMSFAIDGTLVVFGGTSNTIDDFKDSDKLSKSMIKDIVFKELIDINSEMKTQGANSTVAETEKIDPPLREGDINPEDEQIGKEPVETPPFEIYIKSVNDVNFKKIYKTIYNGSVVWTVEAQVYTSWGKIDEIFNYIFCFKVDANNGNIIEAEVISGS